MAINISATVSRVENCMIAPMDNELVVVSLDSNAYISLDDIGKVIWDLLETPQVVESLYKQLQQLFAGTEEEIRDDLLSFLAELESEGLLHVSNGEDR